jgi:peptide/nickel transport system permease protein
MFPTLCVEVSVRLTYAILFVATLSFLGLGVQPPIPNWGLMVSDGQNFIASNPVMAFAPAAAIAVLVVGIHLVADAVSTAYGIDERRGHGN